MERFMKNAVINARIESELKVDVESILKNLGLSATQAINMFYQQIKMHNGIPFEVKIPNVETQRVIEESRVLTPKVLFKQERDEVSVSIKVDFMEKLFDERVDFNLALILLDMEGKRHFYTLNPKEGVADFHDFVLG